jgi:OPT oligopeptide transporter protein
MTAAHGNPLWLPFQTLCNTFVGYLLSIGIYIGLFYGNIWNAQNFPFMSTMLFSQNSNSTKFVQFNQTAILNSQFEVDPVALAEQGLPWLTASHAFGMTVQNMGIMAAFTHMTLWHWDDIKSALDVFAPFKKIFKPKEWDLKFWKYEAEKMTPEEAEEICPHYRLMLNYDDVPGWWFGLIWIVSAVTGLIMSRLAGSTLEVWAFIIALIISASSLTFFAALIAMFGFHINVQPLIQMIGAYLLPGRPLANLYFATFGFNSLYQAKNMLKDLKLGQYVHLAPRCTFTMQSGFRFFNIDKF